MNCTKIEYLTHTWSPLVGCSGKDCAVFAKCWARYQAKRRMHACPLCYEFKPHAHLYRGNQPAYRKKPAIIGACFSADMWDEGFSREQQQIVLDFAKIANWHWFINLTKKPQNIPKDLIFPQNWIQGVSICTRKDIWRIGELMATRAGVTCVSFEPLYEDLWAIPYMEDIDWVIIGAQTHPLKLPEKNWVDSIIFQTEKTKIPVFIKNNLSSLGYNLQEYPKLIQSEGKN